MSQSFAEMLEDVFEVGTQVVVHQSYHTRIQDRLRLDLPDEAGLLAKNLHINDWVRAVERRPGHVDLQRVCGDRTQAKDAQPQRQRAATTNRGVNYGSETLRETALRIPDGLSAEMHWLPLPAIQVRALGRLRLRWAPWEADNNRCE